MKTRRSLLKTLVGSVVGLFAAPTIAKDGVREVREAIEGHSTFNGNLAARNEWRRVQGFSRRIYISNWEETEEISVRFKPGRR